MQLVVAGSAAIAMLALFDAARPDTTDKVIGAGSVRPADAALDSPLPAGGPVGRQFPQTPPNLGGGFAADDGDDQAQQQALQQMQQAQQQAEQQNEEAQQQAQQAERQGQWVEDHPGP